MRVQIMKRAGGSTVLKYSTGVPGPEGDIGPQGPIGSTGPTTIGTGGLAFETRAALAGATVESTVKYAYTAGYASVGDVPRTSMYERMLLAPSDPTNPGYVRSVDRYTSAGVINSTNGGYWQLVALNDEVWVEEFGALGDAVVSGTTLSSGTDNWAMFEDCKDFIVANRRAGSNVGYAMRIGRGQFYLSDTHQMKGAAYDIKGVGRSSGDLFSATNLVFARDKQGIIGQRINTIGFSTVEGVSTGAGADNARISDLLMFSLWSPQAHGWNNDSHGIMMRCRLHVHNVTVFGFGGAGVYVYGENPNGNANGWSVSHSAFYYNGLDGIYIFGADANSGKEEFNDCSWNGRFGVYDLSFLGNAHENLHTSFNGMFSTSGVGGYQAQRANQVSHGGKIYWAKVPYPNQPAPDYTIEPGTSPAADSWYDTGTTGAPSDTIPAWSALGTYRSGGAWAGTNSNAPSFWVNCYAEGGQVGPQHSAVDISIGGAKGVLPFRDTRGLVTYAGNFMAGVRTEYYNQVTNKGYATQLGATGITEPKTLLKMTLSNIGGGQNFFRFQGDANDVAAQLIWGEASASVEIGNLTGPYSNTYGGITYGRDWAADQGSIVGFQIDRLFLGSGNDSRRVTMRSAAPASGSWAVGDRVFKIDPVPGGIEGWVCTTAGVPGTWKAFGSIAA